MDEDLNLKEKINKIRDGAARSLVSHLGISFTELSRERVCGTMPVDERTRQPFGILHGGASAALAESLASVGAWLNIDTEKFEAAGIEINANHLRPVASGAVTGCATPAHIGRSTQVWEILITDEAGKKVCISRCTIAIISKKG